MDRRTWYQLRVQGHLDSRWSEWFGMSITHRPDGTTALVGPVVDQAALYGLIAKVRNLGLVLLAVTQCPPPDERV